jgi:hypothetical protein
LKFLLTILLVFSTLSCNIIQSVTNSRTDVSDSFFDHIPGEEQDAGNSQDDIQSDLLIVSSITSPTLSVGVNPRPKVTVTNILNGDVLRLYTDSGCISEVGSIVASGSSSAIPVSSALTPGIYTFYVRSERAGTVFPCSDTSVTYTFNFCPIGYVYVPGSTSLGVNDFCVMQYEASNSGGAVSDPTNVPWSTTSQDSAYTACTAIGVNYDLIANPEWMALARNIESIDSNWSGATVGSGCLFIGNVGDVTPCSYDGADPENGISRDTKARHILSTGDEVWDLGGNLREWNNWTVGGGQTSGPVTCSSGSVELNALSCGELLTDDYLPNDSSLTSSAGIGVFNGGTGGAAWRGNYYAETSTSAGIYNLSLGNGPSGAGGAWGFRCVYRP